MAGIWRKRQSRKVRKASTIYSLRPGSFAVLSRIFVTVCEDFGLRWQLAEAKRSEDWSAAATPLLSAGESKFVREALVRAKAAWRFASRRSPNIFGCGLSRAMFLR